LLSTTSSDGDLAAVAAALGSPVVAAEPVGWGDARATLRVVLRDGRTFAVRRMPGSDPSHALRIAAAMNLMADAGLPTARPALIHTAVATWLSVPWVHGTPGAAWLDEPGRARRIADRMGQLARRIGGIQTADLAPAAVLVHEANQAKTIDAWLSTVALEPRVHLAIESAIRRLDAADLGSPTLIHGDYAPINVIVDDEGEISALLDLEHTHVGRPHTDVAWWGWVVRHHHPEAWAAAWPTFRLAAGVDPSVSLADLNALALVQLVERAATASVPATRHRWLERVDEAATWPLSLNDQAT
jgi:aminoglycoside phosphotransferase (APT) family kinase protein